jgi:hypothetical protein
MGSIFSSDLWMVSSSSRRRCRWSISSEPVLGGSLLCAIALTGYSSACQNTVPERLDPPVISKPHSRKRPISFGRIICGAVDDERIESLLKAVASLAEHILTLDGNLAELEAAVGALKASVATQLSPDDPIGYLNQLRVFEKKILAADPRTGQRKNIQEALEAVQQWRRTGGPPHES